ncbi:MAG: alkene reductase [gamma proteobacterium symbiont of Taylorina sp.]|nr:alkene reductase [gamma proteobacterium symbiont of Taylorina sp.]
MRHKLFEPFTLGSVSLKNRTVMAPMTRCRSGEGDTPTPLMATYYSQRATAGLILTEGTPVSPKARGYLWTPGIYTQEQIEGWKRVSEAVHNAGGQLFMQIWHVGRISHQSLQPDSAAPEGPTNELSNATVCFAYDEQENPGNVPTTQPKAIDAEDIQRIKQEFVQAALNARQSGIDGVEIHGANGYLFDEFLNSIINTRQDGYGDSIENRCHFLLEVVDAVSDAIGADRTGVRISPNGRFNDIPEDPQMEATFIYLSRELNQREIAFLHINDQGTFGLPSIPEGLIPKIRYVFSGPIILCGGYDAERAKDAIDQGIADLVAFGVPFIANPDLPARLEHGWSLNEADRDTFYGGEEQGYTDYPFYEE